jgi:coproporphyrinogen dehydrogenase HemZ
MNEQSPWGDITGIRPVKMARKLLQEGKGKEQVVGYFLGRGVLPSKAQMTFEIAMRQQTILKTVKPYDICLYIGIPFCRTKCLYCSFVTNTTASSAHLMEPFLAALKKEIRYAARLIKQTDFRIISVYMGGGTPTTLSGEQLEEIICCCQREFDLSHVREFTVEAGRPDTITLEKLQILKANGVGRISINPQTMNQRTLQLIGRQHTPQDVIDCFWMARNCGFTHINMDLIAGLPQETEEDFRFSLQQVEQLSPESTTVHTLSIKRGSRLQELIDDYPLDSGKETAKMVEYAAKKLIELKKPPYYLYRQKHMLGNLENVGYAKQNCACLYNIMMMEETSTVLSVGCGGVTKYVSPGGDIIKRTFNVKEVSDYINRIDEMCERKNLLLTWLNL